MNTYDIWSQTLETLRRQLTKSTFDNCLLGSELVSDNGVYTIQAPNELALEWLKNRLNGKITAALSSVTGDPLDEVKLQFIVRASDLLVLPPDDQPGRVRNRRKSRRFYIDNELIDLGYAAAVGTTAVAVYNVLCRRADADSQRAWPSIRSISDDLGIAKRETTRAALRLLAAYHLIAITERHDERGHHSHTYDLLDVAEWLPLEVTQ